ncbi:hypothetical protein AB0M20_14825 [Actinoplanes sp. NPDC051633]|uniref:hypothetical protein n=1 Tax=Actinoplanes sp. NPDC051633 TaxID=3155670 RepID=UPI00343C7C9C
MPDEAADPSMNTEAFRAFTETPEESAPASKTPLIIGGAVLAVIVVAVILWLAL